MAGTRTYRFGAGKRESHDSSAFYARFDAPAVGGPETVNVSPIDNELFVH